MRYLVPYNENRFLDTKEILHTLNDICLDFEDDGLTAKLYPDNDIKVKMLSIQDYVSSSTPFYIEVIKFDGYKKEFKISDYIDTIQRVIRYMESKGYNTKVMVPTPHHANRFIEIKQGNSFAFELHLYTYTLRLEFERIKQEPGIDSSH